MQQQQLAGRLIAQRHPPVASKALIKSPGSYCISPKPRLQQAGAAKQQASSDGPWHDGDVQATSTRQYRSTPQHQQQRQQDQQQKRQNQQQQQQRWQQKKLDKHGNRVGRKGPRSTNAPRRSPADISPTNFASISFMQVQQLQVVVQQHRSRLNASQLVAVVLRVAKLRPVPSPEQRDDLLGHTWATLKGRLKRCKDYEVVLVLWAAAKLGYADEELYYMTLKHVLEPRVLEGLSPRFLSNVVYAVASAPAAVRNQHAPAAIILVLPVLLQPDKLAVSNDQDICNVLWGLGSLGPAALMPLMGQEHRSATIQQLLERLQHQLRTAAPQGVSSTLWAMARLGQPTPHRLVAALLQQLLARADRAAPQDVSNSLWAVATMHHQQQQLLPDDAQQQPASPALHGSVLQLLQLLTAPGMARRIGCHSLSVALWATAKLGVDVPAQVLQLLLELCVQHSSTATTQDVANIMHACATMQLQQEAEAHQEEHQRQQQWQPGQHPLRQDVQQQGHSQPLLPQHQADVLLSAAAAGAQQAEPQAISNTLWAAAKMGLRVDVGHLKPLIKAFTTHIASTATAPQNIANALYALAVLQAAQANEQDPQQQDRPEIVPERVVAVLLEAFVNRLQDSSPQEVANSLHAAAKLQYPLAASDLHRLVLHALGLLYGAPWPHAEPVGDSQQELEAGNGLHFDHHHEEQQQHHHQHHHQQQRQHHHQPPQQQQLKPQEAVTILWSIATMQQTRKLRHTLQQPLQQQQQPLVVPVHILQQLLSIVMDQLPAGGDQELSTSLWAAARMEPCVLPVGLLSRKALAAVAGRVGGVNLQAVSNIAYALGQLGVVEAEQLLVLLLQRGLQLTQQLTAAANTDTIGNASSSSSSSAAGSRVVTVLPDDCKLQQAVPNLCWSAAVLGVRGQAGVLRALAAACAAHSWPLVTQEGANQLYMLHLSLQLEEQQQQQQQQQQGSTAAQGVETHAASIPAGGLQGCLTPQQLQDCRAAWTACSPQHQLVRLPVAETPPAPAATHPDADQAVWPQWGSSSSSSSFMLQRKVFVAACQLSCWRRPPSFEALTADEVFSVDIAAETQCGLQLAIEVDGPSHYRLPDMAHTGMTLFRNRQLAARGYVVVSVPYTGWNAAVAAKRRQQQQQVCTGEVVDQLVQQYGEEPWVIEEGLLGVEYLQGLVDAATSLHSAAAAAGMAAAPSASSTATLLAGIGHDHAKGSAGAAAEAARQRKPDVDSSASDELVQPGDGLSGSVGGVQAPQPLTPLTPAGHTTPSAASPLLPPSGRRRRRRVSS